MRWLLSLLTVVFLASATASVAQDVQSSVVQEFRDQGYGEIVMRGTFLGKIRLTGSNGAFEREVIVDPRTGEILRDRIQKIVSPFDSSSDGSGGDADNRSGNQSNEGGGGDSSGHDGD